MINDRINFENNLHSATTMDSAARMCRFFIDLPRKFRELKKTLRIKCAKFQIRGTTNGPDCHSGTRLFGQNTKQIVNQIF